MDENNQNPQLADNRFAAIVIGGTGNVGTHLVNKLINSLLAVSTNGTDC